MPGDDFKNPFLGQAPAPFTWQRPADSLNADNYRVVIDEGNRVDPPFVDPKLMDKRGYY